MTSITQRADVLGRKLDSIFQLTDEEKSALARLPKSIVELRGRQDIVREGDRPSRVCLLLDGFACRYKMTSSGKRQIFSFHIPGEMPDLQSVHIRTMDHSLATLTSCKVGFVNHEDFAAITRDFPRIGMALWKDALVDAAIFRQWIIGLGRKEAAGRVAHLLCELFDRLRAVELTDNDTCPFPLTQTDLGDALGLSTVHVNRTLQELRTEGLISVERRSLTIKDPARLRELADFDPTYLHQLCGEAA